MAVTANITQGVSGSFTSTADTVISGTPTYPFSVSNGVSYNSGTGAGQVDRVYAKTRTVSASANEDLDLAGALTDNYGTTITFARIKSIYVTAATGNTNNVQVTRPASNGVPWLMAAGDGIALRPGSTFSWNCGSADSTGVVVTAGTGDLINVANSGGTTSVTYTIVVTGCSA